LKIFFRPAIVLYITDARLLFELLMDVCNVSFMTKCKVRSIGVLYLLFFLTSIASDGY